MKPIVVEGVNGESYVVVDRRGTTFYLAHRMENMKPGTIFTVTEKDFLDKYKFNDVY